ncbi:response regulator [Acidovorax sp. BL-A-41-H1]|uniref:response regulator n=1 Tax=Acidovorax sp. BL-A-41-H1 TaxID=3421102 RepID=UPI003F7B3193
MSLAPPKKLRVLVADDHPLNLRLAVRVLRDMGHGGVVVSDGAQALRAMEAQDFDLVLMDVTMPVLDGVRALHAIRQREAGATRTPVIMITGHDSADDRARLLGEGADGYLPKPLDSNALQGELQRLKLV